jgi:hypothetical protein
MRAMMEEAGLRGFEELGTRLRSFPFLRAFK